MILYKLYDEYYINFYDKTYEVIFLENNKSEYSIKTYKINKIIGEDAIDVLTHCVAKDIFYNNKNKVIFDKEKLYNGEIIIKINIGLIYYNNKKFVIYNIKNKFNISIDFRFIDMDKLLICNDDEFFHYNDTAVIKINNSFYFVYKYPSNYYYLKELDYKNCISFYHNHYTKNEISNSLFIRKIIEENTLPPK